MLTVGAMAAMNSPGITCQEQLVWNFHTTNARHESEQWDQWLSIQNGLKVINLCVSQFDDYSCILLGRGAFLRRQITKSTVRKKEVRTIITNAFNSKQVHILSMKSFCKELSLHFD